MAIDGAQGRRNAWIAQRAGALEMGYQPLAQQPFSVHCTTFGPGSEGSCGARANEGNPL
jgi:hypothetical protein